MLAEAVPLACGTGERRIHSLSPDIDRILRFDHEPRPKLRSLQEGFAARHTATCAATSANKHKLLRSTLKRIAKAVRARGYSDFRHADLELHETIALGDPAAAEDAARSHVDAVWFRLAEQTKSTTEPEGDPLQRAVAHLVFRLHCPLKLTEVASRIAFTSPGNLSRLFRQQHGLSFQAYLQRLRLEKAAELLRTTRLPIARIAKRVGYRDVSRFGQHFKRLFEATPAVYRVAEQR